MSGNGIQHFIHQLEEGRFGPLLKGLCLSVFCLAIVAFMLVDPLGWRMFKGLSHPHAMEQAAIAREISRGEGLTTKVIRPLAIAELEKNKKSTYKEEGRIADTYHAPLWPTTLAPFFKLFEKSMTINPGGRLDHSKMVYYGDRVVLLVSVALFYLGLFLTFRTVRRLFDSTIAWVVTLTTLLCMTFWQYAMSGLPQMLLFFLLSGTLYTLVRAMTSRAAGGPVLRWLALASVGFGLLALTHALTIWLFAGALVFCVFYFKPRWRTALTMLVIFLALFSPWLVRNYQVSGNALGLGWYANLYGSHGDEFSLMRRETPPDLMPPVHQMRAKLQNNVMDQFQRLSVFWGGVVIVPFFFLALLHPFKRPETAAFRWLLLILFGAAVLGMAFVGIWERMTPVISTNLHVLLIPFLAAYGMALLLILVSRSSINSPWLRRGVIGGVIAVSILPLYHFFSLPNRMPFHWPPYTPPITAQLNGWVKEGELLASDAPWAVAWYADRRTLWLPNSLKRLEAMHDYKELGAPFAGVYLTPVSGNQSMFELLRGPYKEWAPLWLSMMTRSLNLGSFPFREILPLPMEGQVVFFSDWKRWNPEDVEAAAQSLLEGEEGEEKESPEGEAQK